MSSSQAVVFVLRTFQTDGITGYLWRDRVSNHSRRALSGWPIAVEFGFFPVELHASRRGQAYAGEYLQELVASDEHPVTHRTSMLAVIDSLLPFPSDASL
jgi:hypothetical protein